AGTQPGQRHELVEEFFRVTRPGVVIQPRHGIKRRPQSLAFVWHADHHGVGLSPEATGFLRGRYPARAAADRRPAARRRPAASGGASGGGGSGGGGGGGREIRAALAMVASPPLSTAIVGDASDPTVPASMLPSSPPPAPTT